jgi:ribosomal protein S18 acetylase RimI-like enzyme
MPMNSIALRPARDDDQEFLYRVYASTREEELAVVPWSAAEKEEFLRMQFRAQDVHYRQHYADARYDVILLDGEPVGRLYVDRRDDEIRIIDIALLAEHRRKGIGGSLLRELLDEAAAAGKPVRIHVEHDNPAMSLYTRLGFVKVGDTGVYDLMEWRPDTPLPQS